MSREQQGRGWAPGSLSELGKQRPVWEWEAGVTASELLFVACPPTGVSDAELSQASPQPLQMGVWVRTRAGWEDWVIQR